MGALDQAVRSGKALYAGISSYSAEQTAEAAAILRELGTPCLIHQPSYSMINRWVEGGLLDTLGREGIGCIAFSPLAQGMLTDKYLDGIPDNSRVARGGALPAAYLSPENLTRLRALDAIARRRGQTLAQMALAWVLKDPQITSVLIGASRPSQIESCVGALASTTFTAEELDEIDGLSVEAGLDLWTRSRLAATPAAQSPGPPRTAGESGHSRARSS